MHLMMHINKDNLSWYEWEKNPFFMKMYSIFGLDSALFHYHRRKLTSL